MPPRERHRPILNLEPAADALVSESTVVDALVHGTVTEMGLIPRASNDTRLMVVEHAGRLLKAVFKPGTGERPLHDFPAGTLFRREVAAYRLSSWLGLGVVPPTVLRADVGAGPGSLQAYVEGGGESEPVAITPIDGIPAENEAIFAMRTEAGHDLVLSHHLRRDLRALALFDVLANNADRKAGHVIHGSILPGEGPRGLTASLYGIDNGLTFHTEAKLRTVLWGFAHSSLDEDERDVAESLADGPADLIVELGDLVSDAELEAMFRRAGALLEAGRWPDPPEDRSAIPWPPI